MASFYGRHCSILFIFSAYFISIFYPVLFLFCFQSETHKFTFEFGACCKTKLIFYGDAHLQQQRMRGAGGTRFSKFMARVSVSYVPLHFFCYLHEFFVWRFPSFLYLFMHGALFSPYMHTLLHCLSSYISCSVDLTLCKLVNGIVTGFSNVFNMEGSFGTLQFCVTSLQLGIKNYFVYVFIYLLRY